MRYCGMLKCTARGSSSMPYEIGLMLILKILYCHPAFCSAKLSSGRPRPETVTILRYGIFSPLNGDLKMSVVRNSPRASRALGRTEGHDTCTCPLEQNRNMFVTSFFIILILMRTFVHITFNHSLILRYGQFVKPVNNN